MEEAQRLYEEYRRLTQNSYPDWEQCKRVMSALRLAATKFNTVLPSQLKNGDNKELKREVFLTREILEQSALLSLRVKDESAFQRCITQLKTYYFDYSEFLPPSVFKFDLLGAHLLYLLAENRIGEFHTELELISSHSESKGKDHEEQIKFAIKLERCKMEGSYNKMSSESSMKFPEYYHQFTEKLMQTSRNDIAESIEKVYDELSISHALNILMFKDTNSLLQFIEKRGWRVEGEKIRFVANEQPKQEIGAPRLIAQNLRYANELERII